MLVTDLVVKQETSHNINYSPVSNYNSNVLKGSKKRWFDLWVKCHLFLLALKTYFSVSRSIQVLRQLDLSRQSAMGEGELKIIKVGRKYYHHLYAPGFPSKIFDRYIVGEFNRISPIRKKSNLLTFIFFAITRKCPLKCEHCLEWDNLNKKESLDLIQLKAVLKKFQQDGISQFHLSGGEPMVRIKDMLELIQTADKVSEFYVLTSGFNFTAANAKTLRQAGLTGVVISLDHYDKEKHNAFRGSRDSYGQVIHAIRNAQQENLVVALSICITREFISWNNLIQYLELAKKMKVVFIQFLEPKAVGHYKGKNVFLNDKEFGLLDRFYEMVKTETSYKSYPILIYHGYHQRRIGCMNGGNRALYIDSEGFVNACPFCHTKNFNIKDILENNKNFQVLVRSAHCPY